MKKILGCVLLAVWLWGCGGGGGNVSSDRPGALLYETKYAERFRLFAGSDGGYVLRVKNPWQGADGVAMDYRLRADTAGPLKAGEIRWPVRRAVCMSSSHVAFLDAVDRAEVVKGVSGIGFITNPTVTAPQSGVRDVGFDNNLNFETLMSLRPDVVFVYGVMGDDPGVNKMRQLGLPVVYIADYLEQNPLGRAEWVIPFGLLVDRMDQAVELFMHIEQGYKELGEMVAGKVVMGGEAEIKPKVMLNAPYRDVWYLPGDRSYMIQLLRDAGADYLGKGYDTEVSRPVSSERALVLLSGADYWLNPGMARSITELKEDNRRFATLPVVAQAGGRVYNNNARITPLGGSDFWESGVVRPDVVLEDLVKILHPDLLNDGQGDSEGLYYFRKLD